MRIVKGLVLVGLIFALSGCVRLTLAWADLTPKDAPATPAITTLGGDTLKAVGNVAPALAFSDVEAWEATGQPTFRRLLQEHVYGVMPDSATVRVVARKPLDDAAYGGRALLEEWTLVATASYNGVARETAPFRVNIVTPNTAKGPVPLILMQSFAPRHAAIRHPAVHRPAGSEGMDGLAGGLAMFVFGRHIVTPPVTEILERGYGLCVMYPSEFVPDRKKAGLEALARLSAGHRDDTTRWGAIAAWGWGFSRVIDALEADTRFSAFIPYGHSRYGKSALVAGAFDSRIDAVISHQSGTGGASLNKKKKGETVSAITAAYPHWFSRTYAGYGKREQAMPLDQHFLLALLAPRPVLLGNARRDVWSDPNGALKAAIGAAPAWHLYGAGGLTRTDFRDYDPAAGIALWMRPGTHGVTQEDWPAFLEFLDAHF